MPQFDNFPEVDRNNQRPLYKELVRSQRLKSPSPSTTCSTRTRNKNRVNQPSNAKGTFFFKQKKYTALDSRAAREGEEPRAAEVGL